MLLINVLLARQRPGRWQIGALVLSYLGVLLAFGHDLQREGGQIIVGSLLVLGSALSYALYLFGSGQVVASPGAASGSKWPGHADTHAAPGTDYRQQQQPPLQPQHQPQHQPRQAKAATAGPMSTRPW